MPPPGHGKALIIFDNGVGVYVQSSVEDIQAEIARVTSSRIPLVRVVDAEQAELWINADHIRAFHRGNVVPLETGVTQTDFEKEERPGRLPFRLARRDPDK